MDNTEKVIKIIHILQKATETFQAPAADVIAREYDRDPFLILISCLLSLRAKDTASLPVSKNLFKVAHTPQQMVALSREELEKIIYSIGFYRQKTKQLQEVSQELLERFDGKVPHTEDELLSIKGIGRKTANLVLGVAFGIPALCVDIHVHRISNRLGLVKTKTPEETEKALRKILPKKYWIEFNKLLVMWGQNICVPVSPRCSECSIFPLCKRVGVTKSR